MNPMGDARVKPTFFLAPEITMKKNAAKPASRNEESRGTGRGRLMLK
jgi:hypothetical protein